MTKVAITQNENIGKAMHEALGYLELGSIITDKIVAVKPNDTWASEQDKTAVTQPDTLQAVLQYIKQFHPKQVLVTGGSGAGETDRIFEIAGLMDVIKKEGVEFFDHNRPPFKEVELSYEPEKDFTGPQKSVMVNPRVLTYETLIDVSQLKLHETATVTLGMKNIAMSFPAADYYGHPRGTEKHENDFFTDMHSFIVAMVKQFPIDLSIIVGHPAMVATGPIGGYTAETGLVIASKDAVAADVVGARLLGFNMQGVRYLWEAGKINLGETDTSNMEFPGMNLSEAIQAFTDKVYGERLTFEHA